MARWRVASLGQEQALRALGAHCRLCLTIGKIIIKFGRPPVRPFATEASTLPFEEVFDVSVYQTAH